MPALKNPEIPILPDYNNPPKSDFWKKFPSKKLPVKPSTKVDYELLDKIIDEKADRLTPPLCLEQGQKGSRSLQIRRPLLPIVFSPGVLSQKLNSCNHTRKIHNGQFGLLDKEGICLRPVQFSAVGKFQIKFNSGSAAARKS